MTTTKEVTCYKDSPDAWQTKFQQFTRMPFPLPWVIVGAILFGIAYAIVLHYEPDPRGIRLLFLDALLVAGIANAVVYAERLLDGLADAFPVLLDEEEGKTREWVRHWYEKIFWSKTNLIWGLGLGVIIGLTGIEIVPHFFDSVPGLCCGYFFSCAIGFLGGSMLWTMLGVAMLMASLGSEVSVRTSIFDSSTSALRSASAILWRISLTAAALYGLGLSTYIICPTKIGVLNMVVTSFFGVFILLYFIVPQANNHKTLVGLKRSRLDALVKQIDNTFDSVADSPTPTNIGQLRDLFDLQRVINGKAAWSFGFMELLALIGTIVLPLSFFAFKYVLEGK